MDQKMITNQSDAVRNRQPSSLKLEFSLIHPSARQPQPPFYLSLSRLIMGAAQTKSGLGTIGDGDCWFKWRWRLGSLGFVLWLMIKETKGGAGYQFPSHHTNQKKRKQTWNPFGKFSPSSPKSFQVKSKSYLFTPKSLNLLKRSHITN